MANYQQISPDLVQDFQTTTENWSERDPEPVTKKCLKNNIVDQNKPGYIDLRSQMCECSNSRPKIPVRCSRLLNQANMASNLNTQAIDMDRIHKNNGIRTRSRSTSSVNEHSKEQFSRLTPSNFLFKINPREQISQENKHQEQMEKYPNKTCPVKSPIQSKYYFNDQVDPYQTDQNHYKNLNYREPIDNNQHCNYRPISIKLPVQTLKPFSGANKDNICDFIAKFRRYALLNNISNEQQILLLPLLLEGSALTTYESLPLDLKNNLDDIFASLQQRFNPPTLKMLKRFKLATRKMDINEDLETYIEHILMNARHIGLGQDDTMMCFVQGLRSDIKEHTLLTQPASLNEALEAARLKSAACESNTNPTIAAIRELQNSFSNFQNSFSNISDTRPRFQHQDHPTPNQTLDSQFTQNDMEQNHHFNNQLNYGNYYSNFQNERQQSDTRNFYKERNNLKSTSQQQRCWGCGDIGHFKRQCQYSRRNFPMYHRNKGPNNYNLEYENGPRETINSIEGHENENLEYNDNVMHPIPIFAISVPVQKSDMNIKNNLVPPCTEQISLSCMDTVESRTTPQNINPSSQNVTKTKPSDYCNQECTLSEKILEIQCDNDTITHTNAQKQSNSNVEIENRSTHLNMEENEINCVEKVASECTRPHFCTVTTNDICPEHHDMNIEDKLEIKRDIGYETAAAALVFMVFLLKNIFLVGHREIHQNLRKPKPVRDRTIKSGGTFDGTQSTTPKDSNEDCNDIENKDKILLFLILLVLRKIIANKIHDHLVLGICLKC